MKRISFSSLIVVLLFLVTYTVLAAKSTEEYQLDYMEGDWYDNAGNLCASIENGYLNGCLIQPLSIAGGAANYVLTIQLNEANGYRHIPLNFSYLREGKDQLYNPFFRPYVSINSVVVHKKNFIIPNNIGEFLYGTWYDNGGNYIATITNGLFNGSPMIVTDFYGVSDHFIAILQVKENNRYKYFSVSLSNMKINICDFSNQKFFYSLQKQ